MEKAQGKEKERRAKRARDAGAGANTQAQQPPRQARGDDDEDRPKRRRKRDGGMFNKKKRETADRVPGNVIPASDRENIDMNFELVAPEGITPVKRSGAAQAAATARRAVAADGSASDDADGPDAGDTNDTNDTNDGVCAFSDDGGDLLMCDGEGEGEGAGEGAGGGEGEGAAGGDDPPRAEEEDGKVAPPLVPAADDDGALAAARAAVEEVCEAVREAGLPSLSQVEAGIVQVFPYHASALDFRMPSREYVRNVVSQAELAMRALRQGNERAARETCRREDLRTIDVLMSRLPAFTAPYRDRATYSSFGRNFTKVSDVSFCCCGGRGGSAAPSRTSVAGRGGRLASLGARAPAVRR